MGKLNSYYSKLPEDDRILVSHILDMIEICERSYQPKFSFFLDERQVILAENVMQEQHCEHYSFSGGYDNASRKVLGVFPAYWEDKENYPISILSIKYRESDKLTHRDFLGVFMSRQIKRNMLGDIVVGKGEATVFVYKTVKDMLLSEISKIGSVGVKITEIDNADIKAEQSFIEKIGTVSSLRLDSVVSVASGLSREKSASLIKGGNVTVMYNVVEVPSYQMSVGETFSVRGSGKFILFSVNGKTKKDRIHITVKKYN
ncbi:MAG: RNA-binding protein [Oscillospiraceae bacterium]|nr:RNA-binding protein [Oscillospiraceae bacterium]